MTEGSLCAEPLSLVIVRLVLNEVKELDEAISLYINLSQAV